MKPDDSRSPAVPDHPSGAASATAPPLPPAPARTGWTAGRITALVIGSLLAVGSLGLLIAGGAVLWADRTQRNAAGFIVSGEERFATDTYALTTEDIRIEVGGARLAGSLLGDLSVRVTPTDPDSAVFIGVGRTRDVSSYLGAVERAVVLDPADGSSLRRIPGGAPATPPGEQIIWEISSEGNGTQAITWPIEGGSWTLVVMNADASTDVSLLADVGATLPALGWIAGGLLALGALLLIAGTFLIAIPAARAGRPPAAPALPADTRARGIAS